jgi:predicted transcriptional regulator
MDKNISTLLAEIKDATGWSEVKIAEVIGTSQPTVNRILNGQDDCKGSTLRAITDLHRTACTAGAHPSAAATSHKLAGEVA